jgi:hypothetical protein
MNISVNKVFLQSSGLTLKEYGHLIKIWVLVPHMRHLDQLDLTLGVSSRSLFPRAQGPLLWSNSDDVIN